MAAYRAATPDTAPAPSAHAVRLRTGVVVALLAIALAIAAFTEGGFATVAVPALLLAAAWLLREAWQHGADARALARARSGQRPQAGAWTAMEGTVVALDEPFIAPLSSRKALACRYEVHDVQRGHGRAGTGPRATFRPLRFEGFHLVATAIDGSHGRVLLRAVPDLVDLPASRVSGGLAPTGFTLVRGPDRLRFAVRAQLLSQPHERLHVDWRYGADEAEGRCESRERVLEPGTTVCAFGRFADGALLPSRSRPRGIPVLDGPAERVLPKLRGETRVYLVMGLIALAGALGLLWHAL